MEVRTTFTTLFDDNRKITTLKSFPVTGELIPLDLIDKILSSYRGLSYYFDCIRKAKIAQSYLKDSYVSIGELTILSGDYKSTFGFNFNPPFELHAWVNWQGQIVDLGLPMVIEHGLRFIDDSGLPSLVDREPIIAIGNIPGWIQYKEHERFNSYEAMKL